MKAIRLRTEYLLNPIGIDLPNPRLFWNCEDGIRQTAWQIVTGQWNSGKVQGGIMHADYPLQLAERERVEWKVRLWDENDTPGEWSETAFFEMGIRQWKAKWISGNYPVNRKKRYPVDCFRKMFSTGPVRKARLYITACGLYEAELNDRRVGDFVLAPGITDYRKRIQYQTYDVTEYLRNGVNCLKVQLADGWFRGSTGAWGLRNQYGTCTALLCQMEIENADGRTEIIGTDETWEWSNDGPIRFADNKDGEIYDAALTPGFGGRARLSRQRQIPAASNNVPVREHERFRARTIRTPSGKTVLDFGQNIAGYISFHGSARKGQRVCLTFGEMLDGSGELTLRNIQCASRMKVTPLQRVEYICSEGENSYRTRFAIFGFRYVQVEGDADIQAENFEAIAVYSDMEETLAFDSSNTLLNRFVSCVRWSTKNNSADLPTDCPTRERHGWTGDAQIFCGTASYLFDYAAFCRKYINDIYDWQRKDGCLPQIAPDGGVDFYMKPMNGSVGWADAGILLPYRVWKQYGDERILKQFYPGMKKYAEFMMRRCGKNGLFAGSLKLKGEARKYAVNAGQSYGEWAEPADVCPLKWTDMVVPHPEVSTAYTAYGMDRMAEIAEALHEKNDADLFRSYSNGCRKAYQALADKGTFSLDTDRQACLVRPLYMNLLTPEQTEFAKKRLLEAVRRYRYRVGTGFLSTPWILDVLTDIDPDTAYRVLENEEMPGWLFMPKAGATTVWESWEGTCAQGGIASLDHYSKGAVLEWVFRKMCGIEVQGENHFRIAPKPGGNFTHAFLRYDSVYGRVESGWNRNGGRTEYYFRIPVNCTADVILPGGRINEYSSGTYRIEAGQDEPAEAET